MTLDVRGGDVLVVSGVEYPVRSCAVWAWRYSRHGLRRFLTVTCDVQRAVIDMNGRLTSMATVESGATCLPLDPVEPDLRERMGLRTPHELLQTVLDGGTEYYHLVVEKLRD